MNQQKLPPKAERLLISYLTNDDYLFSVINKKENGKWILDFYVKKSEFGGSVLTDEMVKTNAYIALSTQNETLSEYMENHNLIKVCFDIIFNDSLEEYTVRLSFYRFNETNPTICDLTINHNDSDSDKKKKLSKKIDNTIIDKLLSTYLVLSHNSYLSKGSTNCYFYCVKQLIDNDVIGTDYSIILGTLKKLSHDRIDSYSLLLTPCVIDDAMIKINKESIKSAVSAIMARNMSHNLGSHIITNTKNEIKKIANEQTSDLRVAANFRGLSELLQYLQERQDFIAVIANGEKYSYGPLNLKSGVFDILAADGLSKRHSSSHPITNYVLNNIVKTEKVYRMQEETTTSPLGDSMENSIIDDNNKDTKAITDLFKNHFKIELNKYRKILGVSSGEFNSSNLGLIYLGNNNDKLILNIGTEENKENGSKPVYKQINKLAHSNAVDEYNDAIKKFNDENDALGRIPIELRIIDKRPEGKDIAFTSLGNMQDSAPISDIEMAIPYGINGRHALLSIIENIIRNSAKHNDLGEIKNRIGIEEFIISIIVEEETVDNIEKYRLTICDNLRSLKAAKKKLTDSKVGILKEEDDGRIKVQQITKDNTIDRKNKGLKEILICAMWLNNSTDFWNIQDKEATEINKLLKFVGVKENPNSSDNKWCEIKTLNELKKASESELDQYSLGYQFYVNKFKHAHVIDIDKIREEYKNSNPKEEPTDKEILEKYCDPKDKDNKNEYTSVYKLPASLLYVISDEVKDIKPLKSVLPRLLSTKIIADDDPAKSKYPALFFEQQFNGINPILYIDNEKNNESDSPENESEFVWRKNVKKENKTEYITTFPKEEEYIEYRTHYEAKYLKDGVSESTEEYGLNRKFIEGISGGNYTDNLVKAPITQAAYMRIVESAYSNIVIVDERIFASYSKSNETSSTNFRDNYFRNKGVFILDCNDKGDVIDLNNEVVKKNSKDVFMGKHIDFLSIHYSLLEKLSLPKTAISNINKRKGKKSDEPLENRDKLRCLFNNMQGIDATTKVAIHSGRGGLIDDNSSNMAFIPLSGLEWALNNCKYILFDLFSGQKYGNKNIFTKRNKR